MQGDEVSAALQAAVDAAAVVDLAATLQAQGALADQMVPVVSLIDFAKPGTLDAD